MKLGSVLLAALALAGAGCSGSSGEPTQCVASFPPPGPTTVCDVAFTCDSGTFGMICTEESGQTVACHCLSSASAAGPPVMLQAALPCLNAQEAIASVNMVCNYGLQGAP